MFPTLETQYDGPVATVWMNRPELHNAFNPQLIADLITACRELDANDAVRVVILAGRGKSGRVPEFWDGRAAERIASDLFEWLRAGAH